MRRKWRWPVVLLAAAGLVATGCGDDDVTPATDGGIPRTDGSTPPSDAGPLPTTPPTTVSMVVNSGFTSPTDAVASNDGATFYFGAQTETGNSAIFSVPSAGGAAMVLHEGDPLEYVSGLVLSLDGATLYIADAAGGATAEGDIYAMPVSGGVPASIGATGVEFPSSLAIDMEGAQLIVSGRDPATGARGVFRVPVGGGPAVPIAMGGELVSPTGLYIDAMGVIWALDHLAEGPDGRGVLFSIRGTDAPVMVASGLRLGTPGGVSLVSGGGTAVVASRNAMGQGSLVAIDLTTMAVSTPADATAMMMVDPAGLRTARGAPVMAIADSEGNAIFSAR